MSLAQSFARTGFARFINSILGRLVRIAAGLGLMGWGATLRGEAVGLGLIAVGLVPLVAGSLDLCLISALLGGPVRAAAVRKSAAAER